MLTVIYYPDEVYITLLFLIFFRDFNKFVKK